MTIMDPIVDISKIISHTTEIPDVVCNLIVDYKISIEKEEFYNKMFKWISGPYIFSDHKNKKSCEYYVKYFSKKGLNSSHQPSYYTENELRTTISQIIYKCFYNYSD